MAMTAAQLRALKSSSAPKPAPRPAPKPAPRPAPKSPAPKPPLPSPKQKAPAKAARPAPKSPAPKPPLPSPKQRSSSSRPPVKPGPRPLPNPPVKPRPKPGPDSSSNKKPAPRTPLSPKEKTNQIVKRAVKETGKKQVFYGFDETRTMGGKVSQAAEALRKKKTKSQIAAAKSGRTPLRSMKKNQGK